MSVERALEVLGLTGAPSQQELRRAYLRKVKEHPPERDRDGFERVREAFDFLKSGVGATMLESAAPPEGAAAVAERHASHRGPTSGNAPTRRPSRLRRADRSRHDGINASLSPSRRRGPRRCRHRLRLPIAPSCRQPNAP